MSRDRTYRFDRRGFLKTVGAGALIGVAGCGGNGDETTTTTTSTTTTSTTTDSTTTSETSTTTQTTTTTEQPPQEIPGGTELRFEGRTSGWLGTAPDSIAGDNNPTLRLQEGAEYTFYWENVDGAPHNVVIENESGDQQYVQTEIITSGDQSVTFTAEAGMATYYCEVHPSSMRGSIEIV